MYELKPFVSNTVWGYELWLASTHPAGLSFAVNSLTKQESYLKDVVSDYPLLIKIIQADKTLSVQVHPDDEFAAIHENSRGKTECWYVLDAKPGVKLICGIENNLSKEDFLLALKNEKINDFLHYVEVEKGDLIFIPAGTVHAISGGVRLLEVQESSNITYRLYDWGRDREMHLSKGLSVYKSIMSNPIKNFSDIFSCEFFSVELIQVEFGNSITCDKDFVLFATEGSGELNSSFGDKINCNPEMTIFCKKNEVIIPNSSFSFIKIISK